MDGDRWYVLRDLKRHNAKDPAWRVLREKGFHVFTPMRERLRTVGAKKIREQVPVIPDLLFVKSSAAALDEEMRFIPTLQYRFVKGAPYRTAMTVPEKEMERFIRAVGADGSPVYYLPGEITSDMIGREVRIMAGPLEGYIGRLLKMRGTRKRRLLISLENYVTAAVEVARDYIELLP